MAWTGKVKTTANTPTYKQRIATRINRGFIMTPDNNYILVGEDVDKVLIFQDIGSLWGFLKNKSAGVAWQNKTKNPIT